jgi:hypothetical protein
VRIATNKIETLTGKIANLKRAKAVPTDARIYPMYYAPIIINEGGDKKIVLAHYHCRPDGKPESPRTQRCNSR